MTLTKKNVLDQITTLGKPTLEDLKARFKAEERRTQATLEAVLYQLTNKGKIIHHHGYPEYYTTNI